MTSWQILNYANLIKALSMKNPRIRQPFFVACNDKTPLWTELSSDLQYQIYATEEQTAMYEILSLKEARFREVGNVII